MRGCEALVTSRLLLGALQLLWPLARTLLRLARRVAFTRVGLCGISLCGILFAIHSCGSRESLRLGTYNIRQFGPGTDLERLTDLLTALSGDVVALQEIQDLDVLRTATEKLSARANRKYQFIASQCGGRRRMHVGFLYDSERLRVEDPREFPELRPDNSGSCWAGARSGLLVTFVLQRDARQRYSILVVHFPAGGTPEQVQDRQLFWGRALSIADHIHKTQGTQVLVLGDVNSTGYLDNRNNERRDIDNAVKRAGFNLLTTHLRCTEYYQPEAGGPYLASHLDHIVASPAIRIQSEARTLSFCESLGCATTHNMPSDYHTVSDHCPVTVEIHQSSE